jgi:hypothetical protein
MQKRRKNFATGIKRTETLPQTGLARIAPTEILRQYNNGKQYRRFEKYRARRKFLRKNYFPPIMSPINAIFVKIFASKSARARGARYTAILKKKSYTTRLYYDSG